MKKRLKEKNTMYTSLQDQKERLCWREWNHKILQSAVVMDFRIANLEKYLPFQ